MRIRPILKTMSEAFTYVLVPTTVSALVLTVIGYGELATHWSEAESMVGPVGALLSPVAAALRLTIYVLVATIILEYPLAVLLRVLRLDFFLVMLLLGGVVGLFIGGTFDVPARVTGLLIGISTAGLSWFSISRQHA